MSHWSYARFEKRAISPALKIGLVVLSLMIVVTALAIEPVAKAAPLVNPVNLCDPGNPNQCASVDTSGTLGSGGNPVINAGNYPPVNVCDPINPNRCAAVSASGALSIAGSNTATPQPAPTLFPTCAAGAPITGTGGQGAQCGSTITPIPPVATATPQPAPTLFPTCAAGVMIAGTGGQGAQCGPTITPIPPVATATPRATDTPAPTATPELPASSSTDSFITSNVPLSQNSYTDIASVTLAAGTWLLLGQGWIIDTGVATTAQESLRLQDNTAAVTLCSGQDSTPGLQNQGATISCTRKATFAQTTTVKLQATSSAATGQANATITNSASGNNATGLSAIPLAR